MYHVAAGPNRFATAGEAKQRGDAAASAAALPYLMERVIMSAYLFASGQPRFASALRRTLLPVLLGCAATMAPAAALPLLPQPRAVAEKGIGFRLGKDI